jgi:hypothetical protein
VLLPPTATFLTGIAEYCHVVDSLPEFDLGCARHPFFTVWAIHGEPKLISSDMRESGE